MGRIVGIDLGTTFSAVAIPEERTGKGFLTVKECPGYSVILDARERRITPSVVAENEKGEIIIGYLAKARAGLSPEPIMFAKRWMGEDHPFQLAKQGVLQPENVSAHILRYLKQVAEERLGEPVDEAVITVPAYFNLRSKQMTEKAGEMAGLRVAQIVQEPVAAALMYCVNDPRDPLRVMTYDLGGGTFDIAILEKRDGTISTNSILAFDGDRFLGGYNFDMKLALWLQDQLNAKGYDLRLDQNNPADKVIFARLIVCAERAKIALSKQEVFSFAEEDPTPNFSDRGGNPVTYDGLVLTRDQFEEMIRDRVEYTIRLCHRARLEKADPPIQIDRLHEILMVGGSSRIPLVARRLGEEFGRKPKLIEPDLCVALGAAIIAGTKAGTRGKGYLKLDPIPSKTDLPNLTVTGQVVPYGELKNVEGSGIRLRANDGSFDQTRVAKSDGKFFFDPVPLIPNGTAGFALTVTSPRGDVLETLPFSVIQTARPGGITDVLPGSPPPNVLAKPISIMFKDGLHEIAKARTPLPIEIPLRAQTRDTTGVIRVPIYEENNLLGEIVMKNIPTTLPIGSVVEITVTIQQNYQICGQARVPSLGRDVTAIIEIPKPLRKTVEELCREYETLVAKSKDALAAAGRGAMFAEGRAKRLKEAMKEAEEMLRSRENDTAAIQDRLDEIQTLIRDIGTAWKPEPPRDEFDHVMNQAYAALQEAVRQKPEVAKDGYDKQLEAIRSEAERAYAAQNTTAWKDSFDRAIKLRDRIAGLLIKREGPPPKPEELLMELARELSALEKEARRANLYKDFEDDFKDLASSLKRIDPKAPDALSQIRDLYLTKFEDVRQRLGAPESEHVKGLLERIP